MPKPLITPVERTRLIPQSYGIATSGGGFGGPRGVWLECSTCRRSDKIAGSNGGTIHSDATVDETTPLSHCAAIFRHHGWRGRGHKMTRARCPDCVGDSHA